MFVLLAGFAACSSGASLNTDGAAEAGREAAATSLPACTWPAALDDPDAGRGSCHPARALLSCDSTAGVFEECASDNLDHCADDSATPAIAFTCHDRCGLNEYAAVCGSIGPGPISDPPAGCHTQLASPGGTVSYCCPCQ